MSSFPKLLPRLLLIEDSDARISQFQNWLPKDVILVVAASAGRAIGILQRSQSFDYAGIMLDHDLQQQVVNETEVLFSGSNVVESIIAKINWEVPVLIHSINPSGASFMSRRLKSARFDVTISPMTNLTFERFDDWLKNAMELWGYQQDDINHN